MRKHKYKNHDVFFDLVTNEKIEKVYIDWHIWLGVIHIWFVKDNIGHQINITNIDRLFIALNELVEKCDIVPVGHYLTW